MSHFYTNKVIWITGASSGIGEALVKQLSSIDCVIVISARRQQELDRLKNECATGKAQIEVLAFDLNALADFKMHTETIISKYKRIDVLFNNGGFSQRSLAAETALEIDRKIMEVNFFASIHLTKCVLPYMLAQKSGSIAVTSSIAGKFGFYLRSAYAASKHALHGFYEALCLENRKYGITVTIICPGSINTNISLHALNKDGKPNERLDARQAKGMDASVCAHQMLKAVAKGQLEVNIGKAELLPVYLKRYIPWLFWKLMYRLNPEKS